jgi:HlyD family secretion protein
VTLTETPAKKRTLTKALISAGVGLLLLIGAGVAYRLLWSGPPKARWLTQKVSRGAILQVVSATGTLQPVVLSPVGAQVSGIVFKIHVDYNSPVKKGQVLVELDPALFDAAVRREEANTAAAVAGLAQARATAHNLSLAAARARALVEQHYIAVSDRDSAVAQADAAQAAVVAAEASIKQAQANLDKVKLDLKNSIILSPVDGIVIARNVELGQAVVASFTAPNLFTIAEDLKKMQVLANVDEADIGNVQLGATAEFTVDSYRGRRFAARVSQIRNAAQTVQNVVTYIVVLDVDNHELLLRPSMTANVRLEVARRDDALLIPSAALRFKPKLDQVVGGRAAALGASPGGAASDGAQKPRRSGGGGGSGGGEGRGRGDRPSGGVRSTVYVVSGDLVEPLQVTTGITDGTMTEVKEGLSEGQAVVIDAVRAAGGSGGARPPGGGGGGAGGGGGGGGGGMRRGGM